jgi:hypothetical protein
VAEGTAFEFNMVIDDTSFDHIVNSSHFRLVLVRIAASSLGHDILGIGLCFHLGAESGWMACNLNQGFKILRIKFTEINL